MTYEEYCEIMDNSNFYIDSENPYDMKIIEALEKQIRKKPIERIDGWLYWDCPLCGAEVGKNMAYKKQHCKCGQTIDWSEEE